MFIIEKMSQMKIFNYESLKLIMINELIFDNVFEILNIIFLKQLNF